MQKCGPGASCEIFAKWEETGIPVGIPAGTVGLPVTLTCCVLTRKLQYVLAYEVAAWTYEVWSYMAMIIKV